MFFEQYLKIGKLHLGPDDCEFDAGVWCHWIQDETDSNPIDWERTSKPTPTFGTGPPGDHTSGFGKDQTIYSFFTL